MNYQAIYAAFIDDRRTKEAALKDSGAYSERHHIIPRAHAGDDSAENLIRLTPEDHFFAHLLLAKVHGGKMWYGLMAMCVDRYGKRSTDAGYLRRQRKSYDVARRNYAGALREFAAKGEHHTQTPEWRAAKSKSEKERVAKGLHAMANPEQRKAFSDRLRKQAAEGTLYCQTPESRAATSARMKGVPKTPESIAKQSAAMRGRTVPIEVRKKMSASHKAREWTEEDQARITAANKAQVWTEERRQKVIQSNSTRTVSEETKAKISAAHKAYGGMPARNKARIWDEAAREKTKAFHRAKAAYSAAYGVPHMKVTKAMIEAGAPVD